MYFSINRFYLNFILIIILTFKFLSRIFVANPHKFTIFIHINLPNFTIKQQFTLFTRFLYLFIIIHDLILNNLFIIIHFYLITILIKLLIIRWYPLFIHFYYVIRQLFYFFILVKLHTFIYHSYIVLYNLVFASFDLIFLQFLNWLYFLIHRFKFYFNLINQEVYKFPTITYPLILFIIIIINPFIP